MHRTNLRKAGGSVMPCRTVRSARRPRFASGSSIGVEKGRLIVEPQKRPRYTLNRLLAQCKLKAARTKEECEWLSDKPAGGELI